MNGCAPDLALIERLKATWKWAIAKIDYYVNKLENVRLDFKSDSGFLCNNFTPF